MENSHKHTTSYNTSYFKYHCPLTADIGQGISGGNIESLQQSWRKQLTLEKVIEFVCDMFISSKLGNSQVSLLAALKIVLKHQCYWKCWGLTHYTIVCSVMHMCLPKELSSNFRPQGKFPISFSKTYILELIKPRKSRHKLWDIKYNVCTVKCSNNKFNFSCLRE